MKVRIITGNKGGVGKSLISLLLLDYLIRHDKAFIAGDAEKAVGQASTWNVMRRHIEQETIRGWKLGTPAGYEELVSDLEPISNTDTTVIIDTGASMLDALAQNLDFLSVIGRNLGIDCGVVFVATQMNESLVAAREYLRAQKELEIPLKTTFLLTSSFEHDRDNYAICQDEDIGEAIKIQKSAMMFLGPIRQEYFINVMQNFKLPSAILKDKSCGYGYRVKLDMWLKKIFDPLAAAILE